MFSSVEYSGSSTTIFLESDTQNSGATVLGRILGVRMGQFLGSDTWGSDSFGVGHSGFGWGSFGAGHSGFGCDNFGAGHSGFGCDSFGAGHWGFGCDSFGAGHWVRVTILVSDTLDSGDSFGAGHWVRV